MTGKERILTALNVEQPDRVPLYIHGINEAPIIGIGKHLAEGLPDMDLKKVKAYCGDKICLLGNIDCLELLPDGTPEQVDAAVCRAIEDAAEGGGYIVCSSNSLHPGVNP